MISLKFYTEPKKRSNLNLSLNSYDRHSQERVQREKDDLTSRHIAGQWHGAVEDSLELSRRSEAEAERVEEAAKQRQANRSATALLLKVVFEKVATRHIGRAWRQWHTATTAAAAEAQRLSAEVAVSRAEKTSETIAKKAAEAAEVARRDLAAAAAERSGLVASHAAEREADLAALEKAQEAAQKAFESQHAFEAKARAELENGRRVACLCMRGAARGATTRQLGQAWRRWTTMMADDYLGEVATEVRRSLAEQVKSKDRAKRMRRLHKNGRLNELWEDLKAIEDDSSQAQPDGADDASVGGLSNATPRLGAMAAGAAKRASQGGAALALSLVWKSLLRRGVARAFLRWAKEVQRAQARAIFGGDAGLGGAAETSLASIGRKKAGGSGATAARELRSNIAMFATTLFSAAERALRRRRDRAFRHWWSTVVQGQSSELQKDMSAMALVFLFQRHLRHRLAIRFHLWGALVASARRASLVSGHARILRERSVMLMAATLKRNLRHRCHRALLAWRRKTQRNTQVMGQAASMLYTTLRAIRRRRMTVGFHTWVLASHSQRLMHTADTAIATSKREEEARVEALERAAADRAALSAALEKVESERRQDQEEHAAAVATLVTAQRGVAVAALLKRDDLRAARDGFNGWRRWTMSEGTDELCSKLDRAEEQALEAEATCDAVRAELDRSRLNAEHEVDALKKAAKQEAEAFSKAKAELDELREKVVTEGAGSPRGVSELENATSRVEELEAELGGLRDELQKRGDDLEMITQARTQPASWARTMVDQRRSIATLRAVVHRAETELAQQTSLVAALVQGKGAAAGAGMAGTVGAPTDMGSALLMTPAAGAPASDAAGLATTTAGSGTQLQQYMAAKGAETRRARREAEEWQRRAEASAHAWTRASKIHREMAGTLARERSAAHRSLHQLVRMVSERDARLAQLQQQMASLMGPGGGEEDEEEGGAASTEGEGGSGGTSGAAPAAAAATVAQAARAKKRRRRAAEVVRDYLVGLKREDSFRAAELVETWRDLAERPTPPLQLDAAGAEKGGEGDSAVAGLRRRIADLEDQIQEMEAQGGVRVVSEALDLVDALQVELAEAEEKRRRHELTTLSLTEKSNTAARQGGGDGGGGGDMSAETARIIGREPE